MRLFFIFINLVFACGINAQTEHDLLQQIRKYDELTDKKVTLNHYDSLLKYRKMPPNVEIELLDRAGKRAMDLGLYDKVDYYSSRGIYLSKKHVINKSLGYFYMLHASAKYIKGKLKEAIPEYEESLKWAEQDKNTALQITVCNNLGGLLVDLKKYDEAEKLLKKGIGLSKKNLPMRFQNFLLSSRILATSYERQNKLKEAETLFEEIEAIARNQNDKYALASILTHQSDLLLKTKNVKASYQKILEAEQIIKQNGNLESIHSALLHKAQVLNVLGDFKGESEAIKEAYAYKLKAIDQQKATQINELNTRYKVLQIKERKKESERKLKEESQKRKWYALLFVTVLIAAILIVLVMLFRQYKRKSEYEHKLQEERVTILIEGEEKERIRIAKELHDGVVQDLTSLYFTVNALNDTMNSDFLWKKDEIAKRIKETANEVRNLSHQMMPYVLKEKGLVQALDELFERSLTPLSIAVDFETFGFDKRLPEKIEWSIYRIVQELLNNVIKHSNATEVNCVLRVKDKTMLLILEDNGVGISTKEGNKGVGLETIKSRLEFIKGKMEMSSSVDSKGVYVKIAIPLM